MSAKSFAVFMLVGFAASLVNSQVLQTGTCPSSIEALDDFDAEAYLGTWYEAERFFAAFQSAGKCVTAKYTLNDDGSLNVYNRQINSILGNVSDINGTATFVNNSTEAKLSVSFTGVPVSSPYWVVGTDYTSYAVVVSCSNLVLSHSITSWILVRDPNAPATVIAEAYAVAKKNGLDTSLYSVTDQTDCTYE